MLCVYICVPLAYIEPLPMFDCGFTTVLVNWLWGMVWSQQTEYWKAEQKPHQIHHNSIICIGIGHVGGKYTHNILWRKSKLSFYWKILQVRECSILQWPPMLPMLLHIKVELIYVFIRKISAHSLINRTKQHSAQLQLATFNDTQQCGCCVFCSLLTIKFIHIVQQCLARLSMEILWYQSIN